jgi:DNA-binding CsgD family transcriptional regulator
MPWLELVIPFLVVIAATSCVTMAVFARVGREPWGRPFLAFLGSSAGVALLTAVGIFLKASGLSGSVPLYKTIWTLSFTMLAVTSWFAIRTALRVTEAQQHPLLAGAFWSLTAGSYLAIFVLSWNADADLYFPYIGGTYAATSLYLAAALGSALGLVWWRRAHLEPENRALLTRFLRIFAPLGALFLADELVRTAVSPPWLPLLQTAPLALYAFVIVEIAVRMRPRGPLEPDATRIATVIAAQCHASPLTRREREVLVQMLLGRRNADIARELSLSSSTVKNHIYHLFQKVGVASRGELSQLADASRQHENSAAGNR